MLEAVSLVVLYPRSVWIHFSSDDVIFVLI